MLQEINNSGEVRYGGGRMGWFLCHTKHTKRVKERGTEGKESIDPHKLKKKYSIHSLWEQKKSMQGGTKQEELCQTISTQGAEGKLHSPDNSRT